MTTASYAESWNSYVFILKSTYAYIYIYYGVKQDIIITLSPILELLPVVYISSHSIYKRIRETEKK